MNHEEHVEFTKNTKGFVEGKGTTTDLQNYQFIDENLSAGRYFYRLKQIDLDGSFVYSSEVESEVKVPSEYALYQNYPNPFNPSTKISYSIPQESFVTLKVFDILGKEISTLVNEEKTTGNYEKSFDGSNLSSGTYVYILRTKEYVFQKKMILMK